ncbi:MAG: hypothetical protein ACKO6N_04115 [Myxococcota bacterium]
MSIKLCIFGLLFCSFSLCTSSPAVAADQNAEKPLSGISSSPPQTRISAYIELMEALSNGKSVRAVIDYQKCQLLFLKELVEGTVTKPDEQTSDTACKLTSTAKPMTCYGSSKEGMDAVGGMKLDTWEKFGIGITGKRADKREYVAASETKLISIRGFVLNYASIRVYEDNEVLVKVHYLDPRDYAIKMDEMFRCRLSNGRDAQGASLFMGD